MVDKYKNRLQIVRDHLFHPKKSLLLMNILYYKLKRWAGLNNEGVDVVQEDWDNLIILDACRYDAFAEKINDFSNINGRLEKRKSKAAYTQEFLESSFSNRRLHDTVYVSANPQLYEMTNGEDSSIKTDFHATVHSFLDGYNPSVSKAIRPGYNPEHTTKIACSVANDFPNKRLIIHYLPPHWPFFGEQGQAIFKGHHDPPWEELMTGEIHISQKDLWDAYVENLCIALTSIEDLLDELKGKTVITADHGQLLGDKVAPVPVRAYGHPGVHVDPLVTVPWFICDHEMRKDIVSEPPVQTNYVGRAENDARNVKEALRDLGYA